MTDVEGVPTNYIDTLLTVGGRSINRRRSEGWDQREMVVTGGS